MLACLGEIRPHHWCTRHWFSSVESSNIFSSWNDAVCILSINARISDTTKKVHLETLKWHQLDRSRDQTCWIPCGWDYHQVRYYAKIRPSGIGASIESHHDQKTTTCIEDVKHKLCWDHNEFSCLCSLLYTSNHCLISWGNFLRPVITHHRRLNTPTPTTSHLPANLIISGPYLGAALTWF